MNDIYIGAQIDTEHGPGKVIDVFQKQNELFAEVCLDEGPRIFVSIDRSQFPDEDSAE